MDAEEGLTTRRVLVVDDAATVRSYHGSILAEVGFAVSEAGNGYEALELTLTDPFDLIVTDVNMPVMDGYSLVAAVRTGTACPAVPIIMISTERGTVDSEAAYEAGANLYLVKPVDPGQLAGSARLLGGLVVDPSVIAPSVGGRA